MKAFLRLLKTHWRWWALPLVFVLCLAAALAWMGRRQVVTPFQYQHTLP